MIQMYRAAISSGTKHEGRVLGRAGIFEGVIVTQANDPDGPLHCVSGVPSEWYWYNGKVFDKLGHLLYIKEDGFFSGASVAKKKIDNGPKCRGFSPARYPNPHEDCNGIHHGG